MAFPNADFTSLISTTLDNYKTVLVDNVFTSMPTLWVMKNEGRIQNKEGGRRCIVDLVYAQSANTGSYSGSDTFTTDDDENITSAVYDWKQYYGLVKVTGIEKAQNSAGKTQIIDLLKARVRIAEKTISENLNTMFWGTGAGNAGKDFIGLQAIIDTGNPSWGNLGGISATANSWWRATEDTTSETVATWGLGGFSALWNTISEGKDHPTHVFTTAALFGAFEALLTPNARYMDPEVADAGFQSLAYKGIPVLFDGEVPAGELYMINFNYITFYTLAGTWFEPSEWDKPVNQDAEYKSYLVYGQMVAENRQRQGVHSAFTG